MPAWLGALCGALRVFLIVAANGLGQHQESVAHSLGLPAAAIGPLDLRPVEKASDQCPADVRVEGVQAK